MESHLNTMADISGIQRPRTSTPTWGDSKQPPQLRSFLWGQPRPSWDCFRAPHFSLPNPAFVPSPSQALVLKELLNKYLYVEPSKSLFPREPSLQQGQTFLFPWSSFFFLDTYILIASFYFSVFTHTPLGLKEELFPLLCHLCEQQASWL